jgi:alcohol dehydrogenase
MGVTVVSEKGEAAMRQLVYLGPGKLTWQEAPDPAPGPREAVVRPLAVARCDLDPTMARDGLFPGPYPVGHETVAEVVAVGDAVVGRRPGERVLVPYQLSCGACLACLGGRPGACHEFRAPAGGAFGFGPAGGGHGGAVADLLAVPAADHFLVPAPEGVTNEALCTLPDNVCDAYRAVGPQLEERPEAEVLIVGGLASSIGLYAAAFAVALGSARVRYVDHDEDRCAAAARLGAEATCHAGPWPARFGRALITVDNTGDAEGLACTLRSTDDYGTCTGVAPHFTPTTEIPLLHMYTKGITFHVSRADSSRLLPKVVDLVSAGRMDPLRVPTRIEPWDSADQVWLEPATKLVLTR